MLKQTSWLKCEIQEEQKMPEIEQSSLENYEAVAISNIDRISTTTKIINLVQKMIVTM
jgi:hypothetical protein